MKRLIPTDELYEMNTIGVKLETQNREYVPTIGNTMIVKPIRRTKYLKVCWMCGTVYESYKSNTYACEARCSLNIARRRRSGKNPPANMVELTKPKNVKEVKERFGYL